MAAFKSSRLPAAALKMRSKMYMAAAIDNQVQGVGGECKAPPLAGRFPIGIGQQGQSAWCRNRTLLVIA